MEKAINALVKADNLLDNLMVSGNNVYILVEARKWMKVAFEELKAESKVTNDGG